MRDVAMSASRTRWATAMALAAVLGCKATDDGTTLVVDVWSDLGAPAEIDEVVVSGGELRFPFRLGSGAGRSAIPVRVALVPDGERDRQFEVEAAGLLDGKQIVSQTAMVSFVPGTAQHLDLARPDGPGATADAARTDGRGDAPATGMGGAGGGPDSGRVPDSAGTGGTSGVPDSGGSDGPPADMGSPCPAPPMACAAGQGTFCESSTTLGACAVDPQGCLSLTRMTCPMGKPCTGTHPQASCSCPAPPAECAGGAGSSFDLDQTLLDEGAVRGRRQLAQVALVGGPRLLVAPRLEVRLADVEQRARVPTQPVRLLELPDRLLVATQIVRPSPRPVGLERLSGLDPLREGRHA